MKAKPEILLAIGARIAYLHLILKGQVPKVPLLSEQEELVVKGQILGLQAAAEIIEQKER